MRLALTAASAWLTSQQFVVDWTPPDPNRPNQPSVNPGMPRPPQMTPGPNRPNPNQPATEKKEEDGNPLSAKFEGPRVHDRIIQVTMQISAAGLNLLSLRYVTPTIQLRKGEVEMAEKQPTPWDLAAAAQKLGQEKKGFPQGAFSRTPSPARAGRPWPPNQRVSWMADLLPHLGYQDVHRSINFQQSWTDKENVGAALTLIPYFINPSYNPATRYINSAAATHYVGLSGIGHDAATYSASDPAAAGKLGIFGYDRATPLSDIDGNTIVIIQVPPPPFGNIGPWMAGGGATVRGVPEKDSVKPFVTPQVNGKPGAYAMMADGSVRFIPENISDEVFKALAVIGKDKKIPDLDTIAPKLPAPKKTSELKAGEGTLR
jgi:hypothetical protein